MSWDIYGEPLRRGYCEVHPHVHEEYPCSVCLQENNKSNVQPSYEMNEMQYHLEMCQHYIKHLEDEVDRLTLKCNEYKSLYGELE